MSEESADDNQLEEFYSRLWESGRLEISGTKLEYFRVGPEHLQEKMLTLHLMKCEIERLDVEGVVIDELFIGESSLDCVYIMECTNHGFFAVNECEVKLISFSGLAGDGNIDVEECFVGNCSFSDCTLGNVSVCRIELGRFQITDCKIEDFKKVKLNTTKSFVHMDCIVVPPTALLELHGVEFFRNSWIQRIIGGRGSLCLKKCDLSMLVMSETAIGALRFEAVRWQKKRSIDGDRSAICNEDFMDREEFPEDPSVVESLYGGLIKAAEDSRDFDLAEDFYFGEMECRARKLREKTVRWRPDLLMLYKFCSGYGTSVQRAGVVLVLLIMIFSLAFLYSGMRADGGERLEYNLCLPCEGEMVSFAEAVTDFSESLGAVLSIATLQKEKRWVPDGFLGPLLTTSCTTIVLLQATVLVFAVRRRYRRTGSP